MKFTCPHCQAQLECDDSFVGSAADCPTCGNSLVIPAVSLPNPGRPVIRPVLSEPPVGKTASVQEIPPPPNPGSASLLSSTPLSSQANPKFRVVFDPQSSGSSPASTFSHGASHPAIGRLKHLSIKMPLVSIVISVMFGLFSSLLPLPWPLIALIALIALVFAVVAVARLHYKCWKAIPAEFARLTPGKAVGYLFIPIFGYYWVFPSIAGLGIACTRLARSKGIKGMGLLGFWGITLALLCCLSTVCNVLQPILPPWTVLIDIGTFFAWVALYRGVTDLLNALPN